MEAKVTTADVTDWVSDTVKNIELRDYQAEAWLRLWQRRAANRKRALIHLATGLGKTSVAAVDALHYLKVEKPNGKILFVSHMNDISQQAKNTFLFVNPKFTTATFRGKLKDVDVTFSTFQALYQQLDNIASDYFSYIIWDEAHHIEAETFSAVRKHFNPEFELGLTATPERADGRDILNYFGHPLYSKSLADGIAEGWLSQVDYHIVFDEAIKSAMDNGFELKTLKEIRDLFAVRTRNEVISKEVLQRRHEIGLDYAKTIVFCQNQEAADAMAVLLGGEVYHSGVKAEDRTDIMLRFKSGKLQVICTVDMFNEGIDIPDARLVVFLRSTSSRTIFEQQLGRGLRRHPGKDKVTVLDFVANVERINFVRDLGHTISVLRGSGQSYSGLNTGRDGDLTPLQDPYFGVSNFDFEDQTIELLDRYETIKGIEYLTRDQVLEAYNELKSISLVAERFHVTWNAIWKHLKKAGIETSTKRVPTEDIVEAYFRLGSANKAAKELGIDSSTVTARIRKAGYETIPRTEPKYTNQQVLDAYNRNGWNIRATARELGQDRSSITRRLSKMNIDTSYKPKPPAVSKELLDDMYQTHNGNIKRMVEYSGKTWTEVYKALDEYGYLKRRGPVTSAQAAAAYYKFGSSTEAGKLLRISSSLISRLTKDARYIPKYGRRNRAKVAA